MPPSSNPRRRRAEDARRQQAQQQAREAAYRRAARKRRIIAVAVLVGVVVATVGVVALASGEKSTKAASSTTSSSGVTTSTAAGGGNNLPPASLPTVAAGATLTSATVCPNPDGSSPRTTSFAEAPPMCIDATKDYEAVIHTTKGDLRVSLLPTFSPKSVNNFVTLARYHYYDGLPITRIVPRGWAEVSDPTGADGTKGPGYSIESETPAQGSIPTPGILAALPTSGSGAAGGGLIIGIADQVSGMPAAATQIGNITDSRLDQSPTGDLGKTVQQELDKAATKSSAPSEVITIKGIDIIESAATS